MKMVFPCHKKKMQFSLVNFFLIHRFRVMIYKKTSGPGRERFYIKLVRPFGSGRILGGEKTINEKVTGRLTSYHATFQWLCRRFCHLDFFPSGTSYLEKTVSLLNKVNVLNNNSASIFLSVTCKCQIRT